MKVHVLISIAFLVVCMIVVSALFSDENSENNDNIIVEQVIPSAPPAAPLPATKDQQLDSCIDEVRLAHNINTGDWHVAHMSCQEDGKGSIYDWFFADESDAWGRVNDLLCEAKAANEVIENDLPEFKMRCLK